MPKWTKFDDGSGYHWYSGRIAITIGKVGKSNRWSCFTRPDVVCCHFKAASLKAAQAEALRLVRERCEEIARATEE